MGKHRTDLPLEKKIYVIRQSESGMSSRKLAKELGVGKTQISNIVKRKVEYLGMYNSDNSPGVMRRKFRKTGNEDVNRVMYEWFRIARSKNMPISGPILQAKALCFAEQLGNVTFTASNGWLASFRKRHQVIVGPTTSMASTTTSPTAVYPTMLSSMTSTSSTTHICSSPVVPAISTECTDTDCGNLPGPCEGYRPDDIWTMGETGLYFKAIPGDCTLGLKSEMCFGGKRAEERLTLVLCCSMTGEKEKPVLIGKSYWPKCFKNLDMSSLPVVWCSNNHAWMTSQTFEDWVKELDKKMREQQRRIVLLLRSKVCHPRVPLTNIQLQFFPPGAPSEMHPLEQGVIKAMKAWYRKILLQHVTTWSCPITVLEAAYWIGKSWNELTPVMIHKCFVASGFENIGNPVCGREQIKAAAADNIADQEAERMMSGFGEGQEWNAFVSFDDQLATHNIAEGNWEQRLVNDLNINTRQKLVDDSDEENSEDDSTTLPMVSDVSIHQVLHCLHQCRDYALQKGDTYIMNHVMDLDIHLCKQSCEIRNRQALLSEFLANKEHRDVEGDAIGWENVSAPPSCIPPIIPLTSPIFKAIGQVPPRSLTVPSTAVS